jgi:hypothetical protein
MASLYRLIAKHLPVTDTRDVFPFARFWDVPVSEPNMADTPKTRAGRLVIASATLPRHSLLPLVMNRDSWKN